MGFYGRLVLLLAVLWLPMMLSCKKDQKTWDPAYFDKKALITVFVPSGNKYKVVPHVLKETDPIAFRNYAADQAVINEASAVLKSIG